MSVPTEQEVSDPRLGRVLLDKYRLDTLLGEGGMGAVYRGEQLSVNRPVAIKLIAGKVAENAECVRRFRREAEAMAKLRHPSTVRLYDFGVADEGSDKRELFMVMELLEGVDLSMHLMRHGRLEPKEALSITRQVLEALAEAHAVGIVHRDLKPANIFLSHVHGGRTLAKVMDFGIAGIEQSGNTKLTMTGAVMGTPAYMSPEQAQGKLVDARSDLYSLGVVLFEMLAGKPPFEADSAVSLLLAQVTTPPPRLFELNLGLAHTEELQALLDVLLHKQPEARPASALAAIELVDELLATLTTGAVPAKLTAQARAAVDSVRPHGPDSQGTLPALPGISRSRGPLAALGLAVLVAALAFALWPREQHAAAPALPTPAAPAAPSSEQPHTVQLVSKPAGAAVELSGVEIGRTPYTLQFRRATRVRFALPGYEAQELSLDDNSEPVMVVELLPSAQATRRPAARPAREVSAPSAVPAAPAPPPPPVVAAPVVKPAPVAPPPAAPRVAQASSAPLVLPPPSWTQPARQPLSARERREAMLRRGPPYRNVVTAKRAYREGKLSEDAYEDTIWVLKTIRANRIQNEKLAYKRGAISRDELERRIDRIDADYDGR